MTQAEANMLNLDDYIVIVFGRGRKQIAQVVGQSAWRTTVRKYQKNSGRWTKPMKIHPEDIIRRATVAEVEKCFGLFEEEK